LKTDNLIDLPDGRKLAYAEYGKPDGHPILHFHGSMSSRLEPLFFGDDLLNHYGLRFIALDRPGMGQSDFQLTYQDEGHISIIINRYDEVFKALTTVSYINLENT
jgi:pimeloyl-ACP methyl ester carboxylesterase